MGTYDSKNAIKDAVNMYWATFSMFFEKTNDIEQARKLTKDMFQAIMSGQQKNDAFSIFLDKGAL